MTDIDSDPFTAFLRAEEVAQQQNIELELQAELALVSIAEEFDRQGAVRLWDPTIEGQREKRRAAISNLVSIGETTEAAELATVLRTSQEYAIVKQTLLLQATGQIAPHYPELTMAKKRLLIQVREADMGDHWPEALSVVLGTTLDLEQDEDIRLYVEFLDEGVDVDKQVLIQAVGAIIVPKAVDGAAYGADQQKASDLATSLSISGWLVHGRTSPQNRANAEERLHELTRKENINPEQLGKLLKLLDSQ